MDKLTKNEVVILERLEKHIIKKGTSKQFLVQLIELSGCYLNIETIPSYAKTHKLSYNGVKKFRDIKELFGVKFVIENT
jgi:hypothetical protein